VEDVFFLDEDRGAHVMAAVSDRYSDLLAGCIRIMRHSIFEV